MAPKFSKQIDWIGATFPGAPDQRDVLPGLDWHHVGKGTDGYKAQYRDSMSGAIYRSDAHDPTMGGHLMLSGTALSELRVLWGCTDDDLCRKIKAMQGKLTRVDLAINIHGGILRPRGFKLAFKRGTLHLAAKKGRLVQGVEGKSEGDTFYAGSRESDRFFRVYDKNFEQKIVSPESWIRLELEIKNDMARNVQNAIASHGAQVAINSQFDDYAQWSHPEYRESLTGDVVDIVEIGRKDTNRQRWLLGQVAQALAKEIAGNPAFKSRFDDALGYFQDLLCDTS